MKTFDITKHKWSDSSIEPNEDSVYGGDTLHLYCGHAGEIKLKKDDAIAIAKHFGIIQEIDGQRITIHKAEISLIPQSETTKPYTYASLNLDSVGEIKRHD